MDGQTDLHRPSTRSKVTSGGIKFGLAMQLRPPVLAWLCQVAPFPENEG